MPELPANSPAFKELKIQEMGSIFRQRGMEFGLVQFQVLGQRKPRCGVNCALVLGIPGTRTPVELL